MVPDLEKRILDFKADLRQMDLGKVIRKHITTGSPAVLSDRDYYDLRNEVAEHFDLHPSCIVIVGSCRIGFSLKPNKRYMPCRSGSDIDLAIISAEKFEAYWDLVFEHWRARQTWPRKRYFGFLRELFKGWIWPRHLPPIPHFKQALEWVEFEDLLTISRFKGMRSVGLRLYRSWDRLEAYQAIHVGDCKRALLLESHEQQ